MTFYQRLYWDRTYPKDPDARADLCVRNVWISRPHGSLSTLFTQLLQLLIKESATDMPQTQDSGRL